MSLVQIETARETAHGKIVFVDNFFCSVSGRTVTVQIDPHLGLMSLGAVLEAAGHKVEICDPKALFLKGGWSVPQSSFLDAWAQDLLKRRADIIGFTAYGRTLPFAIRVAQRIKLADPRQKIVLGGPHATILGARLLEEFECFDVVACYEAEPIINKLVDALLTGQGLNSIPGMVHRSGAIVVANPRLTVLPHMDDIPEAALHLYPIDALKLTELAIEAGRGCPYECTFCSTSSFFQRRYRLKSSRRMIEEMENARARYGIAVFNLNHDLFGLVKPSLREFCELAGGRGLSWKCSMRPDTLDPDLIAALAIAGCRHIYFGVETGSKRMQRTLGKRLDLSRTNTLIAKVLETGINCTVSFITGFPEETVDDQDETMDYLGKLLALSPRGVLPQLHILSPEPGSPLSDKGGELHFDGFGPEAGDFLDQELITRYPDIFSVFYHYPSVVPRWRTILASMFVTHVMSTLGYALTVHIVANFFSGSLAAFFREIVREPASGAEHRLADFESALSLLWLSVDRVIASLANVAPYMADAVRFSRILSATRRQPSFRSTGRSSQLASLAHFDYDIQTMVKVIVEEPARQLPPQMGKSGGRWCLISEDTSEHLMIAEVARGLAAELEREANAGALVHQRLQALDALVFEL